MKTPTLIGWREWIALPSLGIAGIKAKIDTGARTTALHAIDIEVVERDGVEWLEFTVPAAPDHGMARTAAPLHERREVKNTSGVPDERPVIVTTLSLGRKRWPIEVTLADRTEMGFDIILGRTAIRGHGILVNPGRSFLSPAPLGFTPPTEPLPDDTAVPTESDRSEPIGKASL